VRSCHWDAEKSHRVTWVAIMRMVDELRLSELKEDGGSCARVHQAAFIGFPETHHVR
jgi:hypothetical protein